MDTRGILVPDEGERTAGIVFVGETPGAVESIKGKPFVGPAGKTFNRLLASAGIVRASTFITNVVPYYRKEGIERLLTFGNQGKVREIEQEYPFEWYRENLKELLNTCSANVIVPVGRTALYAILGETNIVDRRGSIFTSEKYPNKKIIPTIHPAATIRSGKKAGNYMYTYYIIYDLMRAKEESLIPEVNLPNRKLIIKPRYKIVMDYLRECANHEYLSFDIETTRTRTKDNFQDWEISCLSISYESESAICIPFIDKYRDDYWPDDMEYEIWVMLKQILTSSSTKIILQNGMFDANFIKRKYGFEITNMEDTMIAQGILTPGFSKSLGFLCSIHTKEPYYKDDSKQHARLDITDTFYRYSARDSAVLHDIFPRQQRALLKQGNMDTYRRTIKLMSVLLSMQAHGMRVDLENLSNAKAAIQGSIKKAQILLNRAVIEDEPERVKELNANSPKQLQAFFYVTLGIKPIIKDGAVTVNEDALKKIISIGKKGVDAARCILELRRLRKLSGTYFEVTLDEGRPEDIDKKTGKVLWNRLRCSFNPVGTVTGRLSSSKTIFNTGGNLQNQPKSFKQFIIPDPGYLLYNVDYSQAENRIVAQLGPEPKMLAAFKKGRDVHSLTASLIFDIPYEDIKQQAKDEIPCTIGPGNEPYRYWGKRCNHALNYGMGEKKFALTCEIPIYEARRLRNAYLSNYPGIKSFQNHIEWLLKNNARTLLNLQGRKRKFFGSWDIRLFEMAYAQIPQSTVADLINSRALIPLHEIELFSPVETLNQVHDSVVFQIPLSIGLWKHAKILTALKISMEHPVTDLRSSEFIIPVDIELCKTAAGKEPIKISNDVEQSYRSLKESYLKLYK